MITMVDKICHFLNKKKEERKKFQTIECIFIAKQQGDSLHCKHCNLNLLNALHYYVKKS